MIFKDQPKQVEEEKGESYFALLSEENRQTQKRPLGPRRLERRRPRVKAIAPARQHFFIPPVLDNKTCRIYSTAGCWRCFSAVTYNPRSQCLHRDLQREPTRSTMVVFCICSTRCKTSVETQQQHYFIWKLQADNCNGNSAARIKSLSSF